MIELTFQEVLARNEKADRSRKHHLSQEDYSALDEYEGWLEMMYWEVPNM